MRYPSPRESEWPCPEERRKRWRRRRRAGSLRSTSWRVRFLRLARLLVHVVLAHEVVLLRVVAERAEGHPQELRRLRLHALAPVEGFAHEALADGFEVRLEIDSLDRQAFEIRHARLDAHGDGLRKARRGDDRAGFQG